MLPPPVVQLPQLRPAAMHPLEQRMPFQSGQLLRLTPCGCADFWPLGTLALPTVPTVHPQWRDTLLWAQQPLGSVVILVPMDVFVLVEAQMTKRPVALRPPVLWPEQLRP
mmetsp:Transcript_89762/g.272438  ORF Transcript_89762/g.272438 Transcript_89762/m.272438 type:complete len:110 (+) Transcript_89762:275-604(+)